MKNPTLFISFALSILLGLNTLASVQDRGPEKDLATRVAELETSMKLVKARLTLVEKATPKESQPSVENKVGQGWRDKAKWRQLKRGMTTEDVKMHLGEPGKIMTMGTIENWYYPDVLGGQATFSGDKLNGWNEP